LRISKLIIKFGLKTKRSSMKKTFVIILSTVLAITFSCSKNTEGNPGIIKQENESAEKLPKDSLGNVEKDIKNSTDEFTDRYVADDGSSALVTFKTTDNEKSISIRSNNKTISAKQKKQTSEGIIYGNYDFEILSKTDTIKITQGNNVIVLKKARVQ
jgi:predicted DNA binding CopG/RHH family protein